MCCSVDSVSPAELSSGQQSFAAPSAAPHIRGADLLAFQSGSGRPLSLLQVACSAAQVTEPVRTRKTSPVISSVPDSPRYVSCLSANRGESIVLQFFNKRHSSNLDEVQCGEF